MAADLLPQFDVTPSISSAELGASQVPIDVLRLDLLHPLMSGNKWYKLKHHLRAFNSSPASHILTFGGAFSNHLHALAYATFLSDIPSIGLVRGEAENLSPTLQDCQKWGMKLVWLGRGEYRKRNDPDYLACLSHEYPNAYIVPEGGGGLPGVQGVSELIDSVLESPYDLIACPVGSGTTLAGVIAGAKGRAHCLGFSALKGARDLETRVGELLETEESQWEVNHDYHFGGFAKVPDRLIKFCRHFHEKQGVLLDPVYTSKMMWGLRDLLDKEALASNQRILVLHTGGLQGWRGIDSEMLNCLEFS